MAKVIKLSGVPMNSEISKKLLNKFYNLFHDYNHVYQLIEIDPKVYVQFCQTIYQRRDYVGLALQYKNLHSFYCILNEEDRANLLKMFDALRNLHDEIQACLECDIFEAYINNKVKEENAIKMCLAMGEFFTQYGLFNNAIVFLNFAEYLSRYVQDVKLKLEALEKLIYLDAILHRFKKVNQICIAHRTVVSKTEFVTEQFLHDLKQKFKSEQDLKDCIGMNLATLYSNLSYLHFTRSRYDLAYQYAVSSIKYLSHDEDMRITIRICHQASKAFAANNFYFQAKYFIDQAMNRAKKIYFNLDRNPNFAEILMDYAFFLKKFGKYKESQAQYEKAIKIYKNVFSKTNLHIAIAERDLAETLEEGNIQTTYAVKLIENAISYMEKTLPSGEVEKSTTMLVNAYMVKALLLIKLFKSDVPSDRYTKQLHQVKTSLDKEERVIAQYCGVTSSLYTKYLIVLTKIYFTTSNDDYAIMRSRCILGRPAGSISTGRNLHEALVKSEMASILIRSCTMKNYGDEIIKATLALESSTAIIAKTVVNAHCRELGQYYLTLKDAHIKIAASIPIDEADAAPFENKCHDYELRYINWKRDWETDYHQTFTDLRDDLHNIKMLIDQVEKMEPSI